MPNDFHPSFDQIHIEQLEISARIGVPEEERAAPQRLVVSISFWPYHALDDLADKIENAIVRDQSVNLIETLADRLAMHLLKHFRIQKITIELRKFPFKDAQYVSVTVTRTASVS
jgi:dihydroneopterin aldolase